MKYLNDDKAVLRRARKDRCYTALTAPIDAGASRVIAVGMRFYFRSAVAGDSGYLMLQAETAAELMTIAASAPLMVGNQMTAGVSLPDDMLH